MIVFRSVNNHADETLWIAHLPDYGGTKRGIRKALHGRPTIVEKENPRKFKLHSLFAYTDHGWNGTSVLEAVRDFVAERCRCPRTKREDDGRCELWLQDQSFRTCDSGSLLYAFSLGFKSMLEHGRTWYERNGFEMIATDNNCPSRDEIARALRTFKNLIVDDVILSLRRSAERTRFPSCREMRKEALCILCRNCSVSERRHPRLGKCLLAMPCEDYVTFMRNTYPIVNPNLIPSLRNRRSIVKCLAEEEPVHGRDAFEKASFLQTQANRVEFRAFV